MKLIFTLSLAVCLVGCRNDTANSEAKTGDTLILSGQVYISEENYDIGVHEYTKFSGNLSITDGGFGGDGKIKNGRLSYTIGRPSISLNSIKFLQQEYDKLGFVAIEASVDDVGYATVNLGISGSGEYHSLKRENITFSFDVSSADYLGHNENIVFVYVDKDVSISGKGASITEDKTSILITTKDFNLSLKKGWNTVYTKTEGKGKINDMGFDNFTVEIELSMKSPSLKWVLYKR